MIPRRIFQTWKSKTVIPPNMEYWQSTWKKHNPAYEFVLWDDADNREFIKTYYPWFLEKYDSYDAEIKRADAIRYFYLYHYGGIYVDMDFECIRNIDQICELERDFDIILGKMGADDYEDHDDNIPNAIMLSKPRQPFWLFVIIRLMEADAKLGPELCTGPVILKRTLEYYSSLHAENSEPVPESYKDILNNIPAEMHPVAPSNSSRVIVVKSHIFYPINWRVWDEQVKFRHPVIYGDQIYNSEKVAEMFPESFAVTYWTHSW